MSHDIAGRREAQAGAALLTAMIIVTLIASLAAAMVWRQYRAVQIESAERSRAQSAWILQGALDWARLILREDAISNLKDPWDHLGEVWNVPLAEARLSTFLSAEPSGADDGPEAFLSGSMQDAQSRYNLRNLLGGTQVDPLEQRTLERLCASADTPPGTAALIIDKLREAFATPATNPATAPLQPANLDQLSWFGVSANAIERLRPMVTLLPIATPVNLNTASREVIAGLFDGMTLSDAQRLVQARQSAPLRAVTETKNYFPATVVVSASRASVVSSFFIVSGKLRLDERQMEERSLVQRRGLDVLVLDRQRVNQVLDTRR